MPEWVMGRVCLAGDQEVRVLPAPVLTALQEERNCTGIFFVGHGHILLLDCRRGPLRQPEVSR